MSQTPPTKGPDQFRGLQAKAIRRTGIICAVVFFGMVGAAFASVPLYRAFCQATGFDGATRKGGDATQGPGKVLDQTVTVRFDTNVNGLPWAFKTEQVSQTIKVGATGLAFFKVTNTSDKAQTGRALYNVVPQQAGPYFVKLECFCFTDQTLKPGQSVDFPVVYFIDPRFATDSETQKMSEVTLSYTFFPSAKAQASDKAAANGASALGGTTKARL
jgi:cytochrome c oxidase assembly protein subunit 11